MTNEELEEHDFSRSEIRDGIDDVLYKFGMQGLTLR